MVLRADGKSKKIEFQNQWITESKHWINKNFNKLKENYPNDDNDIEAFNSWALKEYDKYKKDLDKKIKERKENE